MNRLTRLKACIAQRICRHRFRLSDLKLTGFPEPEKPDRHDYEGWMKYYRDLEKSDFHLRRVRWPCLKCGRVFYAHCGLDIMTKGVVVNDSETRDAAAGD